MCSKTRKATGSNRILEADWNVVHGKVMDALFIEMTPTDRRKFCKKLLDGFEKPWDEWPGPGEGVFEVWDEKRVRDG